VELKGAEKIDVVQSAIRHAERAQAGAASTASSRVGALATANRLSAANAQRHAQIADAEAEAERGDVRSLGRHLLVQPTTLQYLYRQNTKVLKETGEATSEPYSRKADPVRTHTNCDGFKKKKESKSFPFLF
jgi:hypothetical protein